jgi:hypothetical protein
MDWLRHSLAATPHRQEYPGEAPIFKTIIMSWIVLSLFSTCLFQSALVQKLTLPTDTPPINNINQLLADKLPLQSGELLDMLIDQYPQYSDLKSLIDPSLPMGVEQGFELAWKDQSGMVVSIRDASYEQRRKYWDSCQDKPMFHIMSQPFMESDVGWVTAKHSYLQPIFEKSLLAINAAGLVIKWNADVEFAQRETNLCDTDNLGGGNVVLRLTHLRWLFILYAIAVVGCFLVFLVELWVSKI